MHTHAHPLPYASQRRSLLLGIGLNLAFAIAEAAYGFAAGSLALLADAGHNVSDVLGLIMALGAVSLAARAPSARFTYGLQSASILAALISALLLLAAVGGIGWQAFQRFTAPHVPAAATMMVVAAVGVAVNGITAWIFHRQDKSDLNMRAAFWHMAADAGVSLGVVISGALIALTGWLWLDPAVSLFIIAVIVASTWPLLRDSLSLALHGVPSHIDAAAVRAYLAGLEGVREVHDLHIWAMGTSGVALSAHLLMPAGHPGDNFIEQTNEALAHEFDIVHVTLQIEIGDGMKCSAERGHG